MLPLLSALSAYLLKSLRRDNGSAAKITLLGPGRAGLVSPNPRPPHPLGSQPLAFAGLPFSPSPGRPPPARTACTCAWRASPGLPDLDLAPPPLSQLSLQTRAHRRGNAINLGVGMPGLVLLASWKLSVGGGSWCVRAPMPPPQSRRGTPGSGANAPHRLHF